MGRVQLHWAMVGVALCALFPHHPRLALGASRLSEDAEKEYEPDFTVANQHHLKDQILRVEHRSLGGFMPEIQNLLPIHITPGKRDKPADIVAAITKVPCGKDKTCPRAQPIWWIEEHVAVVQELMRLRKSGQLPGEKDKKNKRFILFSTFQPFNKPPAPGTDKRYVDAHKVVGELQYGLAKYLDALLVFDQEVAYAYKHFTSAASGLRMHWMRAWPRPLNPDSVSTTSMTLKFGGGRRLQGLFNFRSGRAGRAPSTREDGGQEAAPRLGHVTQGEGDLKGRYLAASCGSVSGCAKRDWSSLLLGLRHANERLANEGIPQVNLKVAVRITAILVQQSGGLQMGASPIPDCTYKEACEVVSLGDADYMEFLQAATIVVVPVTKNTEPGVGLRTVVDALSRGVPVLSGHVPSMAGYIKNRYNGVLVPVESPFQSTRGYDEAIYQFFSLKPDPAVNYTLHSIQAGVAEDMVHYTAEAVVREIAKVCEPFTRHLVRREPFKVKRVTPGDVMGEGGADAKPPSVPPFPNYVPATPPPQSPPPAVPLMSPPPIINPMLYREPIMDPTLEQAMETEAEQMAELEQQASLEKLAMSFAFPPPPAVPSHVDVTAMAELEQEVKEVNRAASQSQMEPAPAADLTRHIPQSDALEAALESGLKALEVTAEHHSPVDGGAAPKEDADTYTTNVASKESPTMPPADKFGDPVPQTTDKPQDVSVPAAEPPPQPTAELTAEEETKVAELAAEQAAVEASMKPGAPKLDHLSVEDLERELAERKRKAALASGNSVTPAKPAAETAEGTSNAPAADAGEADPDAEPTPEPPPVVAPAVEETELSEALKQMDEDSRVVDLEAEQPVTAYDDKDIGEGGAVTETAEAVAAEEAAAAAEAQAEADNIPRK